MKNKDILMLVVSVFIIGFSVYFIINLLQPPQIEVGESESDTIPAVPTEIDETTYKNVESLSDYGTVTLDGIGKSNLFAGF